MLRPILQIVVTNRGQMIVACMNNEFYPICDNGNIDVLMEMIPMLSVANRTGRVLKMNGKLECGFPLTDHMKLTKIFFSTSALSRQPVNCQQEEVQYAAA